MVHIRGLVSNGHFSERSLALATGISQPHIHHLLSGARSLTVAMADHLLACLQIPLINLMNEFDVIQALKETADLREASVAIPALAGSLGPAGPYPSWLGETERLRCRFLVGLTNPALVRLGADPEMTRLLGSAGFALLDRFDPLEKSDPEPFPKDPDGLYAVARNGRLVVRGLRTGRNCAYLLTAKTWNRPREWQSVPPFHPAAGVILLPGDLNLERRASLSAPAR